MDCGRKWLQYILRFERGSEPNHLPSKFKPSPRMNKPEQRRPKLEHVNIAGIVEVARNFVKLNREKVEDSYLSSAWYGRAKKFHEQSRKLKSILTEMGAYDIPR